MIKSVNCVAVGPCGNGGLLAKSITLSEYHCRYLEEEGWECVDSDLLHVGAKAMLLNEAMAWGAACRRKAGDKGWEATIHSDGANWHVKFWKKVDGQNNSA